MPVARPGAASAGNLSIGVLGDEPLVLPRSGDGPVAASAIAAGLAVSPRRDREDPVQSVRLRPVSLAASSTNGISVEATDSAAGRRERVARSSTTAVLCQPCAKPYTKLKPASKGCGAPLTHGLWERAPAWARAGERIGDERVSHARLVRSLTAADQRHALGLRDRATLEMGWAVRGACVGVMAGGGQSR